MRKKVYDMLDYINNVITTPIEVSEQWANIEECLKYNFRTWKRRIGGSFM